MPRPELHQRQHQRQLDHLTVTKDVVAEEGTVADEVVDAVVEDLRAEDQDLGTGEEETRTRARPLSSPTKENTRIWRR